MKSNKSRFFCIIAMICLLLCLCACGDSTEPEEDSTEQKTNTISSEYEAINMVMNSGYGSRFDLTHRIGACLNFTRFSNPAYGSKKAVKLDDGTWDVTIKGSMTGSTDEYATNIETKKFEVKAHIDESGKVSIIVSRSY